VEPEWVGSWPCPPVRCRPVQIRVTLRNGNQYLLALESPEGDLEGLFNELAAGRSQALRGWVAVTPLIGAAEQIVVQGDEIVELHLIDGATERP
jgi:hypothetical protein